MSAPSVSVIYHSHDDRLHLYLTSKEEQYKGLLTRRLLKSLLKRLPTWLAQQTGPVQESATVIPLQTTKSQKQSIVNQFQYQSAQETAESTRTNKLDTEMDGFLVTDISFSVNPNTKSKQQYLLKLMSQDKQQRISLSLSLEQLYKMIGVMLEKAADWDLDNPWVDEVVMSNNAPNQLH